MAAISGVIKSLTRAETMLPKAAPITTAIARSTTLPRRINSRKPFICCDPFYDQLRSTQPYEAERDLFRVGDTINRRRNTLFSCGIAQNRLYLATCCHRPGDVEN